VKFVKLTGMLVLLIGLVLPAGGPSRAAEKKGLAMPTVRFGTLPVLQSLPIFVASEKGFYKEKGLKVEIVLFPSAMEKDMAFNSGRIDGYFGDMMTPMVLQANQSDVRITATNFNTSQKQRMFAILASPRSKNKTLEEISGMGIATSSNTISEYLIVRILQAKKVPREKINLIDVKNIPIRLQMLLSNQVPAALLPEPLATLAEIKGAKALLDDKGRGLSATVLAFSDRFLKAHPETVKAFLAAVNQAADYINKNPDEVRFIMNRECRMPEPLRASFPIPEFPQLAIPSPEQILDVYGWLRGKQIISKTLTYKDLVVEGYLP
jgi:NitT/TauT family transport system substrate-binding protein